MKERAGVSIKKSDDENTSNVCKRVQAPSTEH